ATVVVIGVTWTLLIEGFRQKEGPFGTALVVVLGAAAIALALQSPQGGSIIAAIVALSTAANRFDERTGNVYAGVIIAAYLAAIVARSGLQPVSLLSYGLGLSFAFLASRSVGYLREEQARTTALLHELQANHDAQVEAAAINERARIAREIHDVLAHTLAALAVQLEGARLMLERRGDDFEALAAVERAHRLAKEGIDETRSAVSALRGDRVPGPDQLAQLVEEFKHDSGTAAELRVEGVARPLAPDAQLAIYRTAQEALTNVRKHAHPERVEAVLRFETGGTELTVTDVGAQAGSAGDGGYGLLGMRERAELLGGKFEAGRTDSGFRVRLWLPG
ncbi:MAG TPA: sensor histidine kinase, partial [Candidatus Dormibacteraeota bacterium]|nr:sensor histidine kinase [Candidatus Dormibacteraeota bacterium]